MIYQNRTKAKNFVSTFKTKWKKYWNIFKNDLFEIHITNDISAARFLLAHFKYKLQGGAAAGGEDNSSGP